MTVRLPVPDDYHVHLRQAPILPAVVRETARWFGRALAMPNTVPPVTTPERLEAYRREILAAVPALPAGRSFEPLLVFKVVSEVSSDDVAALAAAGAIGGKLYPQGVTTNSADGVSDVTTLFPVFERMEELDLVLEIHAEDPASFCLDRERAFLPTIERIAARFPRLRIVIEHVSDGETVRALASMPPTVAATVTVHHLYLTLDDVVGDTLRPHHFCKPIAKRPEDRAAIRDAVLGGNPRVFFGSDSAPHPVSAKETDCGCAGVYTAPVAIPLLAELFDAAGLPLGEASGKRRGAAGPPSAGPSLAAFVARYGADFYRLPPPAGTITITEREWVVPDRYDGVVPFYAGARLRFDLAEEENHHER